MAKNKKQNPRYRRADLSVSEVKELISEECKISTYHTWLLVFNAMGEIFPDTTRDTFIWAWETAYADMHDRRKADALARKTMEDGKYLIGFELPYQCLKISDVKTECDLARFVRRNARNAVYSSMGICAMEMYVSGMYSREECRRLYMSCNCTEEEILSGVNSYEALSEHLTEEYGIELEYRPEDIEPVHFFYFQEDAGEKVS